MIEIKPCPFCGNTAKLAEKSKTYYKGELTYNTYVYCPNCDTRGRRAILSHFPTNSKAREHVIEAWNRRAELESIIPIVIAEQERMFQEVTRIEAERLKRAMQGSKFCPPEMELVGIEMNPEVTKWLEKIAEESENNG